MSDIRMHIETGIKGDPGVSIVDATVNNSGHLIVVLSNGSQIDAGVAKGHPVLTDNPRMMQRVWADILERRRTFTPSWRKLLIKCPCP